MELHDPAPAASGTNRPRQDESRTKHDVKPTLLLFSFRIICDGLRALLERMGQLAVVGQCSEASEAMDILTREKPDLAIMDLDFSGLELIQTFVAENPSTRFIVLSTSNNEKCFRDAASAGVKGYVLRTASAGKLLEAIECVLRGGTHFPDLPKSPPSGPHSLGPHSHSRPPKTMKAGLSLEIPEVRY